MTEEPTKAEKMLWDIGVPSGEDRIFRHVFFQKVPERVGVPIAKEYKVLFEKSSLREANQYLLRLDEELRKKPLRFNLTDSDICDFSAARARACENIQSRSNNNQKLYAALSDYASRYGISAPLIDKGKTLGSVINRLCDERWWRTKVRRIHGRNLEAFLIQAGFVRKQRGIYASDEAVHRNRQKDLRNKRVLENTYATNESGDEFSMLELSERSISNPRIRRGELMTRISGFEEIAKDIGDVCQLYTMTCPSRMHARFSKSGMPNPKYDGTTPDKAQKHLTDHWALIRTSLGNKGIDLYGLRVCEPHHDGTPHWHFMAFMKPEEEKIITETIRKYALAVDGDEPGAKDNRFDVVEIDWSKGSATGYIAKYISKNIDGKYIEEDSYGKDAVESSERVKAWANKWGIRQFQFFGGPSIGIWRELRRLAVCPRGILGDAFEAADNGKWAEFVMILGGPRKSDINTGIALLKVYSDKPNSYGEPLGYVVLGVTVGDISAVTRFYTWTIEYRPPGNSFGDLIDFPRGSSGIDEKLEQGSSAGIKRDFHGESDRSMENLSFG